MQDGPTHFGYEQVSAREKTARVRQVFDSVAGRYDLMNDLMSAGLHRVWKRYALALAALRVGQRALDLAGGSGDLTRVIAARVGPGGEVVLADINRAMLNVGRDHLVNAGIVGNVHYVQANAEILPFPDRYFDVATMAFGLRNVTDKERALAELYRVLKPGGRVLILEFSTVTQPLLARLYHAYSFHVLPRLGGLVANDSASYRYLAESIRMHPAQDALLTMLQTAGFERCRYHNLTAGVVAVHIGYRL
ncbi:MAG: bifunctional demethylmenaquinone methyltransferase/2-methoxy-6-polyprenyl-1,4-benzoquinol methylase UbiE [Gammaproteobacteria bacterium]|nr:bifunctional demethylmenaquinone methyltransferase/2-methoxy-6-polyprenyl-1,4-benzoquinol methylase UbiE [Gammaproteobacteria bacterium]